MRRLGMKEGYFNEELWSIECIKEKQYRFSNKGPITGRVLLFQEEKINEL